LPHDGIVVALHVGEKHPILQLFRCIFAAILC
jgi:hypothetical protein